MPASPLLRARATNPERARFEAAIIDYFIETADLLGFPHSVAAIYGICISSTEPLSFSEIQERLSMSAGSVSQGIKLLKTMGALRSVPSFTDRRERFAPDLELRKLVARWIDNRLEVQLRSGRAKLKKIIPLLPEDLGGANDVLAQRIRHVENWHGKAEAVLPILRTFLRVAP